jgi:hypothetical protein
VVLAPLLAFVVPMMVKHHVELVAVSLLGPFPLLEFV